MGISLNLEKQIQFYGSYHHHPVNIIIHVICVPVIMLCMLLLGTHVTLMPSSVPDLLIFKNLPPNLATLVGLLYVILYILMEPVAGALLAPLLLSGIVFVNHLNNTRGNIATYWSLGIQFVAWVAQFVGHGVYEGRAPALLDNLVQAFFLAPFFVWLEVLFFLGYRPKLKARIDQAVQLEVAKFNAARSSS